MPNKNAADAQNNGDESLEKSVYIIVAVTSVLLVAIGLIVKFSWKAPDNIWASITPFFLSELGIAGIVALIIIFTIDRFTRVRHENAANDLIRRMNKDLFHAIYNRYIPTSVFGEVEECLLKSNVLRTEYAIDYSLNEITVAEAEEHGISVADRESHLFCGVFSKYRLNNLSDKLHVHTMEMHLEIPIDENMQRFVRVDGVRADGKDLSEKEITESCSKTSTHLVFKYDVQIPPNGHMDVSTNCHSIKRKTDMEVWSSRLPSDGLILRVITQGDVNVSATANHSQALTKETINNGKVMIWQLNYGIFPFQSIIFWWDKP